MREPTEGAHGTLAASLRPCRGGQGVPWVVVVDAGQRYNRNHLRFVHCRGGAVRGDEGGGTRARGGGNGRGGGEQTLVRAGSHAVARAGVDPSAVVGVSQRLP